MKYFKRLRVYKTSNVSFDPDTCTARSYGWWIFVDRIGGKVVFNNHYYSPSTLRHQTKVRRLLDELGIKIDIKVKAPFGLQDLRNCILNYTFMIQELETAIVKPRSHKKKNEERKVLIQEYRYKIQQIKELDKGVTI